MASPKKLTLPVLLAPSVVAELHDVWLWNAERYDPTHAEAYFGYLKKQIDELASRYRHGKTMSLRPDLRYIVIRRKSGGHGHIVVYQFNDRQVDVLHVFHTAQNWQAALAEEGST
jgi:plasmid stabilization system protein ParE